MDYDMTCERSKKAMDLFAEGYNCAQAVLCAYADILELTPEQVALDDGRFELLLVPNPRTPADLQDLMVSFMNQNYDGKGLIFRHASSIRVETEESLPWSLDGEYAPGVPVVEIANRRQALSMLL